MTENKEQGEMIQVVNELPVQPYNVVETEKGAVKLITTNEALTEILRIVKKLDKGLLQ